MVSSCLLIDFEESEAEAIYLEGGVCFVTKEEGFASPHVTCGSHSSPVFHILRWRPLLSLSEILERLLVAIVKLHSAYPVSS